MAGKGFKTPLDNVYKGPKNVLVPVVKKPAKKIAGKMNNDQVKRYEAAFGKTGAEPIKGGGLTNKKQSYTNKPSGTLKKTMKTVKK